MRALKSLSRIECLLPVGLAAFAFLSAFFRVADVDVGYHMRTAEYVLGGNGIPTRNTFSYTAPDAPWMLQQWLGAVVFYLPYRLGGVNLLITFKALVVAALVLMVWATGRMLSGKQSVWAFWTATLGVLVARVRFFERPDLLSAFFCALLMFLEVRLGSNRRWQWVGLPLLMALWANTHSGVIYGFALLGAWCGGDWLASWWRRRRASENYGSHPPRSTSWWVRPAGILLSAVVAVATVQLINPNGAKVLMVPITQFTSSFWRTIIDEYQAPSWPYYKLFALSVAGTALLQLLTWRHTDPKLLLGSAGFGYLACSTQRSMLFFVIVAMPHAAFMLSRLVPVMRDWLRCAHHLLLAAVWIAVVPLKFATDNTFVFGTGFFPPHYPHSVYDFLKREVPPQHLFNDMRYGGSMLWWLYPGFRPFIDGRGDAYSEEFWKSEYFPIMNVRPGWTNVLAKFDAHGLLLFLPPDRKIPPLLQAVHENPDWALVAFDDNALLYLQRTAQNSGVIARNEFRLLWPGDWSLNALDAPETRAAAVEEAGRAAAQSPDSLFAATAFARACLVTDQFDKAAETLRRLLAENDLGENYYRDFGFALFRLGRFRESDKVFATMIRRDMLRGFAFFMRHHIALREGRIPNAREYLEKALAAEPKNEEYRAALERLNTPAQPSP